MNLSKYTANMTLENYDSLVKHIQNIGKALRQNAYVVINRNVTTRAGLTTATACFKISPKVLRVKAISVVIAFSILYIPNYSLLLEPTF